MTNPYGQRAELQASARQGQFASDGLDAAAFSPVAGETGSLVLYVNGHFGQSGGQALLQQSSDGPGILYCAGTCDNHIAGLPQGTGAALLESTVPAPASLALLAGSILMIGAVRRRL